MMGNEAPRTGGGGGPFTPPLRLRTGELSTPRTPVECPYERFVLAIRLILRQSYNGTSIKKFRKRNLFLLCPGYCTLYMPGRWTGAGRTDRAGPAACCSLPSWRFPPRSVTGRWRLVPGPASRACARCWAHVAHSGAQQRSWPSRTRRRPQRSCGHRCSPRVTRSACATPRPPRTSRPPLRYLSCTRPAL
ncbi:hypothetical protein T492DRAFT_149488 [Pavlovales sp. CCMP2436]|nr:hypothetical protein T492DRAFT_149488 [Pavlovales sp. CCMP2436]